MEVMTQLPGPVPAKHDDPERCAVQFGTAVGNLTVSPMHRCTFTHMNHGLNTWSHSMNLILARVLPSARRSPASSPTSSTSTTELTLSGSMATWSARLNGTALDTGGAGCAEPFVPP